MDVLVPRRFVNVVLFLRVLFWGRVVFIRWKFGNVNLKKPNKCNTINLFVLNSWYFIYYTVHTWYIKYAIKNNNVTI